MRNGRLALMLSASLVLTGGSAVAADPSSGAEAAMNTPARVVGGEQAWPQFASTAPGTLGFAFSYFWYDVHETPQDCPEGFAYALRDIAILDMPKEKQEYLLQPENRSTYYKLGYALSAKRMREQNGASICNIPDSYDDPPMKVVQSPISFGRDLDGQASDGSDIDSCGAQDFTSPDGRSGIDNQLYRVMGCVDSFRRTAEFAGGAMEDYHVGAYRDGEITTLMEVRDVDSIVNDDYVEVSVYSSHEPTPYDSQKNGLGYASLTVTDNTLWHNTVKGRIENGELITEPFELRLKFGWTGRPAEYFIKKTQIHLTLNDDGSASGDLVGYFDLKHAYWQNFHDERGALQVANGFTCPAVWTALQKYADGHRDPETGQCRSISTAMKIEAVPAFVIHPPKEQLTKYILDTREYYGVDLAEIAVEGAELRAPEGAGGPPAASDTGEDEAIKKAADDPTKEAKAETSDETY